MLTKEELRDFRQAEGLTQEALAVRFGIEAKYGKDTVRAWESGKRPVPATVSLLVRLIQALQDGKSAVQALNLWTGA